MLFALEAFDSEENEWLFVTLIDAPVEDRAIVNGEGWIRDNVKYRRWKNFTKYRATLMRTDRELQELVFAWLDSLRASGRVNILAAPRILTERLGLQEDESKRLYDLWTERFVPGEKTPPQSDEEVQEKRVIALIKRLVEVKEKAEDLVEEGDENTAMILAQKEYKIREELYSLGWDGNIPNEYLPENEREEEDDDDW
jgi:hypothetical protein